MTRLMLVIDTDKRTNYAYGIFNHREYSHGELDGTK